MISQCGRGLTAFIHVLSGFQVGNMLLVQSPELTWEKLGSLQKERERKRKAGNKSFEVKKKTLRESLRKMGICAFNSYANCSLIHPGSNHSSDYSCCFQ